MKGGGGLRVLFLCLHSQWRVCVLHRLRKRCIGAHWVPCGVVKRSKLRSKSDNVYISTGHAKLIPYQILTNTVVIRDISGSCIIESPTLLQPPGSLCWGVRIVDDSDYEFSGLRLLRLPCRNMYANFAFFAMTQSHCRFTPPP
jgi:hypothetical protein